MPLIDERGRIFGRVNLIDALAVVLVLVSIPLAYGAFLLFRVPAPTILSIQPARILEHQTATVQITGQDLRPFLRARVGVTESEGFLVQSPTLAEIKVPALPEGTYDVALFDQAQELVRKPGALTVLGPPVRAAVATVQVRFIAGPEVVDRMKPGDLDVLGPGAVAEADRAVLMAVGPERQTVTARTKTEGLLGGSLELDQRMLALTCTVRVPVVFTPSGWSYKERPVKVGAPFTFESISGGMSGWILGMKLDPERERVAQ